ncbi:MAG: hypothetical protein IGS38_07860 [Synechococcales cyanobacterium M58_A2018_015]|nr:hypothetical protein [Synechococcales cyanobacterium M58_A2018_015]
MLNHPHFLNVHKLVLLMAIGPLALLSLFAVLDLSLFNADSQATEVASCQQASTVADMSTQSCPP